MSKLRNSDSKELVLEAIRMAWPAVLESFFVALAGMIDTMMVSTLGTYAVAAVGLTTQPKFIALALFLSSNIAVNALAARRFGQKNRENANKILYTAIVFVIISALIISTVTFIEDFSPTVSVFSLTDISISSSTTSFFNFSLFNFIKVAPSGGTFIVI